MSALPARAFVLAGGRGRRMSPLTTVIPKPLVPVGEYSVLEILIRQLKTQGFSDVVISLGYLGHLIRAVIGEGDRFGIRVTYTTEDEPLGTAGALSLLTDGDERAVLVLNGDTLTDLDFGRLVATHLDSGSDATIGAVTVSHESAYGVLQCSTDGYLTAYLEKPTTHTLVSMGINVLGPAARSLVEPRARLDMPDLLTMMVDRGLQVKVEEVTARWYDLGKMDDVLRANADFDSENLRFIE
ncbi:MAG: sugar phosphate nucleotidyltransferase [Ilumatobacteraceae bacterium]